MQFQKVLSKIDEKTVNLTVRDYILHIYLAHCFRSISLLFISLFVCLFIHLSARLQENDWTNFHEIFREGVE